MREGMNLGADDYLTKPVAYADATILGITESTVKKHVHEIFEKLGVETRGAATIRALKALSSPSHR